MNDALPVSNVCLMICLLRQLVSALVLNWHSTNFIHYMTSVSDNWWLMAVCIHSISYLIISWSTDSISKLHFDSFYVANEWWASSFKWVYDYLLRQTASIRGWHSSNCIQYKTAAAVELWWIMADGCVMCVCSEDSEAAEETWLCDSACVARPRPRDDDLQSFCQSHGI